MSSPANVIRLTASGAIQASGSKVTLSSLRAVGLSGDSSVIVYDSDGVGPDAKEIWQTSLQPSATDDLLVPIRITNGGYVKITGTAKVFCYIN
jgi:hypothetical protein